MHPKAEREAYAELLFFLGRSFLLPSTFPDYQISMWTDVETSAVYSQGGFGLTKKISGLGQHGHHLTTNDCHHVPGTIHWLGRDQVMILMTSDCWYRRVLPMLPSVYAPGRPWTHLNL